MLGNKNFTELPRPKFPSQLEVFQPHGWILSLFLLFDLWKRTRSRYAIIVLNFFLIEKHHLKDLVVIRNRLLIDIFFWVFLKRFVSINETPLTSFVFWIKWAAGQSLWLCLMLRTVVTFTFFVFRKADNKWIVIVLLSLLTHGLRSNRSLVLFAPYWAIDILWNWVLLNEPLRFCLSLLWILVPIFINVLRCTDVVEIHVCNQINIKKYIF